MGFEFPIEGRWHINGTSEQAVFGTLTCEKGERLRLIVKIPQPAVANDRMKRSFDFLNQFTSKTLVGYDSKNHPITLYGCVSLSASYPEGMTEIRYGVRCAVTGTEGESWEALKGQTFCFGYSLLHSWMNRTGIQEIPSADGIAISAKHTESVRADIEPGVALTLVSVLSKSWNDRRVELSEDSLLKLEFDTPVSVPHVVGELAYQLQLLLSLLTGERIALDWVSFSATTGRFSSLNERFILADYGRSEVRRDRSWHDLRSTLADMNGRIGEVVGKWLEMHKDNDMREVLALYSSLVHHDFHISAEFIFLAQALEAYHAGCGRFGNSQEPEAEFKARCCRILTALAKPDAQWLKERLAFANQKTYKARLKELLDDAPTAILQIVQDKDAFISSVANNRNAYTHRYGKISHKKRTPENAVLARLSHQLLHIFELLLLRDLGLEDLSGKILNSYYDWRVAEPEVPDNVSA